MKTNKQAKALRYKILATALIQLNGKGMQKDIDAIGRVGVTKRIGSSVLDELDERAGEKISELKPSDFDSSNATDDKHNELSKHFQNVHESQFNKMESLESHYINNALPQTPKRHVENNDSEFSNPKKPRIPIPSSPPVHDITRRIRRLRLRSSLTGGNSNQSRTPSQTALKNTPLTRQRPMDPPRFLRPTINSLNKKNVDTQPIIRNKEPREEVRGTSRPVLKSQFNQPQPIQQREKKQIPRSQSVFERLYSQTTIARSCSMGNVSVKAQSHGIPSRTREHESNTGTNNNSSSTGRNPNTRVNSNSNRTRMTRSQTSESLSSQLERPAWK